MRVVPLLILLSLLSGCATQQLNAYKKQLEQPVSFWKEKVEVVDNPMETHVTYSTEPAITDMKNVFTGESIDAFVRGWKDKQTSFGTLQGYIYISMINGSWPRPFQINYGKPLQTAKSKEIGTDVDCSGSSTWGGCRYTYHLTFPIPMSEVQRLMDLNLTPEQMTQDIWKFRLKFQAYNDFDHGLPVQELFSIYEVMTEDGAFITGD